MTFNFTVYGVPQPQGSTRSFIPKGWTRPIITSDNLKMKPWRQELANTAILAMKEACAQKAAREIPIAIELLFFFDKPVPAKKSASFKTTKPDLDKLLRAGLDGLTGIAYEDDSQVCECKVSKQFDSPARLEVRVSALGHSASKTPPGDALQLFENMEPLKAVQAAPKRMVLRIFDQKHTKAMGSAIWLSAICV